MGAVHIRIRHDDDLIIAQLADIEIVSVSFRKTTAEGIDHRLDLRVGEHLVDACLLHVQDLAADRQDRLIHPVPCRLGAAAGGIPLHDKDLAF